MITVEDYLKERVYITQDGVEDVHDSLSTVRDTVINLIKLHVTEALRQVEDSVLHKELNVDWKTFDKSGILLLDDEGIEDFKNSILNAYPLENIK